MNMRLLLNALIIAASVLAAWPMLPQPAVAAAEAPCHAQSVVQESGKDAAGKSVGDKSAGDKRAGDCKACVMACCMAQPVAAQGIKLPVYQGVVFTLAAAPRFEPHDTMPPLAPPRG